MERWSLHRNKVLVPECFSPFWYLIYACFMKIQWFRWRAWMRAQIMWSTSPRIRAECNAAASGEKTVGQGRPGVTTMCAIKTSMVRVMPGLSRLKRCHVEREGNMQVRPGMTIVYAMRKSMIPIVSDLSTQRCHIGREESRICWTWGNNNMCHENISGNNCVKGSFLCDIYQTWLTISQFWIPQWLGTKQATPIGLDELTHCGLVTSNGDKDLDEYWLR